jgi:AraC-like DNA-binding protein
MKYNNNFYIQLSRNIFTQEYSSLSTNAKWLFVVLNELEHKLTGEKEDFFTRSDEQLAKDAGMSLSTLKRAKKELKGTNLIQSWKCHFQNKETKKLSKVYYTAYRILK